MTDPLSEKAPTQREPWVQPVIEELPPLTDLTLASGAPPEGGAIEGNGFISGGTGSTVF